jgi:hypothetical protein
MFIRPSSLPDIPTLSPSTTTRVCIRNTWVFHSALTALTEPHTLRGILVPSDGEVHAFHVIHTCSTLRPEGGDVYALSEPHVCDTPHRGRSYAIAIYTTPDDVYASLWLSATFYLSAIGIYRMLHLPQICFALRCHHLVLYSLCFEYITYLFICFAIIVFYTSEIYCPIFTLSSTMPSVLHILR